MDHLGAFTKEAAETTDWLTKEFGQISTGRASPALLDGVRVESYGSIGPLKNVASLAIEDPKTLRITPWDSSHIKEIERGLYAADLGFSVSVDDKGVRVSIPALTTERRSALVKTAKEKLEEARIRIRKVRERVLTEIKDAGLPEDTAKRSRDELQKKVDSANQSLEELFTRKETEILAP